MLEDDRAVLGLDQESHVEDAVGELGMARLRLGRDERVPLACEPAQELGLGARYVNRAHSRAHSMWSRSNTSLVKPWRPPSESAISRTGRSMLDSQLVASGRPSSRTRPARRDRIPPIASTVEVLPAPFGPSRAVTSPRHISIERSATTQRSPRQTESSSILSALSLTRRPLCRDRLLAPDVPPAPARSDRSPRDGRIRAPRPPRTLHVPGSCRDR